MVLLHDRHSVTIKERVGRIVYLDTEEVVPPFGEVAGKVPSRLSNYLHPNVVPRHPGNLTPVIHVLLWFVQSVEVPNPRVAIVLAWSVQFESDITYFTEIRGHTLPNLFANFEIQSIGIIDKNVLRGVPPAETHI